MPRNSSFVKRITRKVPSTVFPETRFSGSNLIPKVEWRKDQLLDEAIEKDEHWQVAARVVRNLLSEPGQVISGRILNNRGRRMGLKSDLNMFISQNPGLLDTYMGRIRYNSDLIKFIRPGERLINYLQVRDLIYLKNEELIVAKLCKLLMMSENKAISTNKLLEVRREFGFPDDFLENLVPRYERYFLLVEASCEEEEDYLYLVSWNYDYGKSVIELRAQESRAMGIWVRPAFDWKLPPGFVYRKEAMEWVRDWMELPYISPYVDASKLDPASMEAEKRMVGVLHELLSLSLHKRIAVDVLGKFREDYNYSHEFSSAFTRHSGLFYVSLKFGIRTAMLREAYKGSELIDHDPLLEIHDKFIEVIEEGNRQWRTDYSKLRNRND